MKRGSTQSNDPDFKHRKQSPILYVNKLAVILFLANLTYPMAKKSKRVQWMGAADARFTDFSLNDGPKKNVLGGLQ